MANAVKGFFKRFGLLILAFLLVATFYLFAIMIEKPAADKQGQFAVVDDTPVTRIQASSSTDIRTLARLFGAPLPGLSGQSVAGEARNASYNGQAALQFTLNYPGGIVLTAVRPVDAAPLLLRSNMSVVAQSGWSALSLPAMLAQDDDALCLYFSDEQAAFSLYVPGVNADGLVTVKNMLSYVVQ